MSAISALSRILDRWLRRLRLQRASLWLQRGLAIGVGLGFVLGLLGLDSAAPSNIEPGVTPPPEKQLPVPMPGGGGKGG